jgi:hypothetical protein
MYTDSLDRSGKRYARYRVATDDGVAILETDVWRDAEQTILASDRLLTLLDRQTGEIFYVVRFDYSQTLGVI